ncbi:integral membrane protein mvin [Heliomicrobium modesticaldum Ice1]|uniref:Probable lipid II flippase MurJ n=1 Tax=Heliobacterium modesticaldum (strain ATCC 51547 / Ice1) TaxID=498761 RepID=B0TDC0_HELMI|nr:murein biosynthesis integral membrane protein MurJ [Heliomicrobium modesticaldum]ABZ84161.1 integral membrane protein mvin [Heliomicrobium modesticaldum Ice1]
MTEQRIAKAAALIMVLTLLGRAIGLVREMFVGAKFGAEVLGPFVVAFNLPNIVGITLTGAFSAAFIPLFTAEMEKGNRDAAWRLASAVLNTVLFGISLLVAFGMVFSREVAFLLATDFSAPLLDLTAELLFILFPTLILSSLGGVTMAMLSSLNRYFVSSIGPLLSSLVVIVSIFLLAPRWGIHGVAWGTTLGALLSFLVMIPSLMKEGFRYYPTLGLDNPLVRQLWTMILPVLFGVGVSQIHILIDSNMAASISEESVVALKYANTVAQLPMGVFVSAVAIPMLPALSALLAVGDREGFKKTLARGVSYYALILLPIMAVTVILSGPIIQVLFQREEFDATRTAMTAFALVFYGLGFFPSAVRDLYTRAFYSLHDTATPVKIGALTVFIHVAMNFLFIPWLSHGGLALATSISNALNMVILGWLLYRRVGGWSFGNQWKVFYQALIASTLMGIVLAVGFPWFLSFFPGGGWWATLLSLILVGLVAAAVYGGTLLVLGTPEVKELVQRLLARVRGPRNVPPALRLSKGDQ